MHFLFFLRKISVLHPVWEVRPLDPLSGLRPWTPTGWLPSPRMPSPLRQSIPQSHRAVDATESHVSQSTLSYEPLFAPYSSKH